MDTLTPSRLAEIAALLRDIPDTTWKWACVYGMGRGVKHWAIESPESAAEDKVSDIGLISLLMTNEDGDLTWGMKYVEMMSPHTANALLAHIEALDGEVAAWKAEAKSLCLAHDVPMCKKCGFAVWDGFECDCTRRAEKEADNA